jgi:Flp pilus assembly pilin Flp
MHELAAVEPAQEISGSDELRNRVRRASFRQLSTRAVRTTQRRKAMCCIVVDGSVRNVFCKCETLVPLMCTRFLPAPTLLVFFTIQEQTMKSLMQRAVRFVRDSRGATMAEYAILVAVVAIVVIVGAKALGGSVSAKLNTAATNIESGN